jgi:glycosyltransferase involved in cell wall biosynthesis
MKILLLSRYTELGASSRLRFFQYLPYLRAQSISIHGVPFFSEAYLRSFYISGRKSVAHVLQAYLKRLSFCYKLGHYDLVWIEKECFPWLPAPFEQLPFLREIPYVVDYDDAIHHNYDQHALRPVKWILSEKLRRLVAGAAAVTVGNSYLAEWARTSGADKVEIVPTVIDLDRYPFTDRSFVEKTEFRVGWIGTPTTTNYLWMVRDTLVRLAQKCSLRLVVVGAGPLEDFGLPLERHGWEAETEVSILSTLDVGIMPLPDSPWERGKCGYKLIQYMACGLPVIASSVGLNKEIVDHDVSGFLVDTSEQWDAALQTLLLDASLRKSMGMAGRQKVEQQYCLQVTGPKLVALLKDVAVGKSKT